MDRLGVFETSRINSHPSGRVPAESLLMKIATERVRSNEPQSDGASMSVKRNFESCGLIFSQPVKTNVTRNVATVANDQIFPRIPTSYSSESMQIYPSQNLRDSNSLHELQYHVQRCPVQERNCNLHNHIGGRKDQNHVQAAASMTPHVNNNILIHGERQFHSPPLLVTNERKTPNSGTLFDCMTACEYVSKPERNIDWLSNSTPPTQNLFPNILSNSARDLALNAPIYSPRPTIGNYNEPGVSRQQPSAATFQHDWENTFDTGSRQSNVEASNQNRSPNSASGIRENSSKTSPTWSSYSKPCEAHPQYPTRLFCKTHYVVVCCVCALKTLGGQHSSCNILPKRSVFPDSQTRLQSSEIVDSLVERLIMKLRVHGASDVLVPCPYQHLAFNTSLQRKCEFRISPALTDFMTDVNFIIESLSTCHRRDLEALTSKITNCFHQLERLPDFQDKRPPYLPNCSLHGQGIAHAYKSGTNTFFVSVRDYKGRACHVSDIKLAVTARKNGEDQRVLVEPYYLPGIFKVTYSCFTCGLCDICVTINGKFVPGAPFQVSVDPNNDFSAGAIMMLTIGDSQHFNKPWGVCVDNQENYIIADRCNNCVKVYSNEWILKWYFPEEGTPYSLKKPAGVALDRNGDLVVTDKDNHRVQVFTVSGKPLRRTCSNETAFSFPWGIAVNSQNQYIVTHSKCRVKILSSNLETLHEIPMGDSNFELNPRAISIGYMDEILITEFEGGNVYTLDVNNYKFRLMTRNQPHTLVQASGVKRYQGIAVDRDGYVLVCDSKNQFIEIHNYAGDFIDKWAIPGKPVFIVPLNTRPKSYLIALEEGLTNLVVFKLGGGSQSFSGS